MAYTSINKPSDYFNTKLTTGTGSSQAVTGLGFQPDFIWGKRRDDTGHHTLFDVVRGITKGLETTGTGAEFTSTDYYDSFDSDGFTIAAGASGAGNGSGQTAVQWSWLAGGTASSNTDGSITSSVSANTTSGFSIVSYTGTGSNATVGHGLGAIPKIVIIKNRDRASGWHVGGDAIGSVNQYLNLNDNSTIDNATTGFQSFSSTTFGIGNDTDWNASGESIIAYCFAEKKAFSNFGSYTGNGSTDGPFIYTGFSPSFVMHKRTDTTNNWIIQDNKRVGYNADNRILKPNLNDAEQGVHEMDFVSTGFKIRTTGLGSNASGGTYIYMAFAESPFTTSTGVPTTAR